MEDKQVNRRLETRHPLSCEAYIRSGLIRHSGGLVCDLSMSGCRIKHSFRQLIIGERISITPIGFQSFPGVVKWARGHIAGICFENPLHPAVVDFIVARNEWDRLKS